MKLVLSMEVFSQINPSLHTLVDLVSALSLNRVIDNVSGIHIRNLNDARAVYGNDLPYPSICPGNISLSANQHDAYALPRPRVSHETLLERLTRCLHQTQICHQLNIPGFHRLDRAI